MAEWAFRSASSVATGTISLVITKPADVVDGDIMVMMLSHKGLAYATMPAGWTVIQQGLSGSTRGEMFWRRASGEGADYTITGLADVALGAIRAYTGGLSAGDAVDVSAVTTATTTAPVMPGVTTTINNALVLTGVAIGQTSTLSTLNQNGSLLNDPEAYDATVGSTTTGTDASIGLGGGIKLYPGATQDTGAVPNNPMVWTNTVKNEIVAITVSLKPQAAAVTTATRFYLTLRSHGAFLRGAPQGNWSAGSSTRDNRGIDHWTYQLSPIKTNGGSSTTFGKTAALNGLGPEECWFNDGGRFVTPQLAAQTITGTLDLRIPVFRRNIGGTVITAVFHVHAYVARGDDLTTVVGTLLDDYIDSDLWDATATWRGLTAPQALTSTVIQAGDRIVVEIGVHATSDTNLVGLVATMRAGTTTSRSGVPAQDGPTSGVYSGVLAPYVDFSSALTLNNEAVTTPTNNTRATAATIAALPFTSGLLNATEVTSPRQEIWWSWLSTFTGRILITLFGGNVDANIYAYEDADIAVAMTNNRGQWIQTSQTGYYLDVTSGSTYSIRVVQLTPRGGATQLNVSQALAPETDDLFLNCQHMTSLRGTTGVTVDLNSALYNLTPTGAAIDYSLASLPDQNDDPNTALRYFACLFGSSPDVEIWDLATLNVGDFEIGFIFNPIDTAPNSQNLASIVFDRAGNFYNGYFGDDYHVIGRLSTPAACAITKMPLIDVEQDGPHAVATRFVVDQDLGGTDYVDIDSTNTVLFYTSSGTLVKRASAVDGTQLADFAIVPNAAGPRPGVRGLRLLPPGDGTGGMLVTNGSNVVRLDASGTVIQTYTPAATARAQDLDKVEINAAVTQFWVSDQYSTSLFLFDLETGAELAEVRTGLPPGQLSGFAIYNGYRAGLDACVPPVLTAVSALLCGILTEQTATLTGSGFPATPIVTVTDPSDQDVPVTIVSSSSTEIVVSGIFEPCGTYLVSLTDAEACASNDLEFTILRCPNQPTVTDTGAPAPASVLVLTAPVVATLFAEDDTPTAVTYAASTSGGTGTVTVTYDPPSGSLFSLGETLVTVTATDTSDPVQTKTARFTVKRSRRLKITCPTVATKASADSNPVAVTYAPATVTGGTGAISVVYSKASGSLFSVGVTTVTVTATDSDRTPQVQTCAFTVTVTAPPAPPAPLLLTCPTVAPVTSTNGSPVAVSFAATTSGGVGPVGIVYNPVSGSSFAVGATTVTVTATDSSGTPQVQTGTFTVRVLPPPLVLTCPTLASQTSINGTAIPVTYPAASTSGGTGTVTLVYNPVSGSLFPIGSTIVSVTATDSGSPAQVQICAFTVTVAAPPPPPPSLPPPPPPSTLIVTCPGDQQARSSTGVPVAVTYPPATATGGTAPILITYSRASGAVFPIGITVVSVTATSADGQTALCSFAVTVTASTVLVFENFTASRLNGDGSGLTQIYLGEDPLQTGGYDTANGRFYTDVGAPNNGPYVYLAYPRNAGWLFPAGYVQTYLKSGAWPPTPAGTTSVNRISFWVKPSVGQTRRADGGDITQFGTYIRDHNLTDAASQGAHYYHLINPNYYANKWHKMTFNGTPQHQVGRDPTTNWGNEPELVSGSNTGGNGQNVGYMDGLSHFYFDTQNGVAWASNSRWTFAQIEFETVNGEPDAEISSLVGVYSGTKYELSWAGLKNTARTYEIVYSANSLKTNGWASGTSGGTTTNPASAYTGCIWTLTSSELTTGLYVGVRVAGGSAFTEFHFTYPYQPTNPA